MSNLLVIYFLLLTPLLLLTTVCNSLGPANRKCHDQDSGFRIRQVVTPDKIRITDKSWKIPIPEKSWLQKVGIPTRIPDFLKWICIIKCKCKSINNERTCNWHLYFYRKKTKTLVLIIGSILKSVFVLMFGMICMFFWCGGSIFSK
jgi:hypothetical protein